MTRGTGTGEREFQGQVLSWINHYLKTHELGYENVTQEFKNTDGKFSDAILWKNHAGRVAILEIEMKTPVTPLEDRTFQQDAIRKAQKVDAPYCALWNMRRLSLYRTPKYPRRDFLSSDLIAEISTLTKLYRVDDWLKAPIKRELEDVCRRLLLTVHDLETSGHKEGQILDATVFVEALTSKIRNLRALIYNDFVASMSTDKKLKKQIIEWATKQGLIGFVDDLYGSLSSQLAYRLVGQVLFYYSFRRQERRLPELKVDGKKKIIPQLRIFWDEVRTFDYEALYDPSPLETIPVGKETDLEIGRLISELATYDWDHVSVDILGAIFEQMIPEEERVTLGQYYTKPQLADLILGFAVTVGTKKILDPAVGTGTFLMRSHNRLRFLEKLRHEELLERLWGVDISAFAAELCVINLCRMDLTNQANFPRVAVRDFFDLKKGDELSFPPSRRIQGGPSHILIKVEEFDAAVGNPPYIRSQQLDDLDAAYKTRLNIIAARAGVTTASKFDAFAYFIVHVPQFLKPGGVLAFVVSAAWLTSKYGTAIQKFLLSRFSNIVIIGSEIDPFFPNVDVNTVVITARKNTGEGEKRADGQVRFVMLSKTLEELLGDQSHPDYWSQVDGFVANLSSNEAGTYDGYRIELLEGRSEHAALLAEPNTSRNWARPLRMTQIYKDLVEA